MSGVASTPFQQGVPVPSILWNTLEETLRANMRRLAKDVAKTLGQSDVPLLEALFKGGGATVRPYIFEEAAGGVEKEIDMRCGFLCQRPETPLFLQPCGQPIVWSAAPHVCRCTEHLYSKQVPIGYARRLSPIEATALEEEDGLLVMSDDGTVYDVENRVRGKYNFTDKTLLLLEIE